ncbi:hypothetical protein JEQ12_009126 [Ovis aries]|uniref:Uncharacterized protein n=1 Tax=Ovis aries TaxID=9940 RepID=A0A836ACX5_SHEEP|nr:hypothetical protein JEQ12_009126 [Ovis aries]
MVALEWDPLREPRWDSPKRVFGDDPWLCHGCGRLSHEVIVADSVAACVNHEDNTCCCCGLWLPKLQLTMSCSANIRGVRHEWLENRIPYRY